MWRHAAELACKTYKACDTFEIGATELVAVVAMNRPQGQRRLFDGAPRRQRAAVAAERSGRPDMGEITKASVATVADVTAKKEIVC